MSIGLPQVSKCSCEYGDLSVVRFPTCNFNFVLLKKIHVKTYRKYKFIHIHLMFLYFFKFVLHCTLLFLNIKLSVYSLKYLVWLATSNYVNYHIQLMIKRGIRHLIGFLLRLFLANRS